MRLTYVADGVLPSVQANTVNVMQMTNGFAQLGHDVLLLTPSHAERPRSATALAEMRRRYAVGERFSIRYLPYLRVRGRLAGSYFPLAALAARARRSDIVYTRNARIATLATRLGCRVMLESHSPPNSARLTAACHHLARSPLLARWIFISNRLRELYAAAMPLPDGRCVVEHDAVDLARFEPALSPEEARARVGLAAGRPAVVHCGHLYKGRGGELLIAAARTLPQADFVFVGGKPEDITRLEGEARAAGTTNVRFTGHLPVAQLPPYLFAADVLVMPYTRGAVTSDGKTNHAEYASQMKLFEYMAAGRAIVATRFPSSAEVLHDGVNARLVEPDSPEDLRRAIAECLADPDRARALGARARDDVRQHTWELRARRILAGVT